MTGLSNKALHSFNISQVSTWTGGDDTGGEDEGFVLWELEGSVADPEKLEQGGGGFQHGIIPGSGDCSDAPSHLPYVFVLRAEINIHIVNISCWIQYLCVMQSKYTKPTPPKFSNGGAHALCAGPESAYVACGIGHTFMWGMDDDWGWGYVCMNGMFWEMKVNVVLSKFVCSRWQGVEGSLIMLFWARRSLCLGEGLYFWERVELVWIKTVHVCNGWGFKGNWSVFGYVV